MEIVIAATSPASSMPSAKSVAPVEPIRGCSAVAKSAPLANCDTSTFAAKSGAVATSVAIAAIAASAAPIAVSSRPCGRSAVVSPCRRPRSAERRSSTASPSRRRWREPASGTRVLKPPGSGRQVASARASAAPSGCDKQRRRNEQQVEHGQPHQHALPGRVAPKSQRADDEQRRRSRPIARTGAPK